MVSVDVIGPRNLKGRGETSGGDNLRPCDMTTRTTIWGTRDDCRLEKLDDEEGWRKDDSGGTRQRELERRQQ